MAADIAQADLISAVEAHPELWDLSHPFYSDRIKKGKTWMDIASALTPGWDRMTIAEKRERSKFYFFQKCMTCLLCYKECITLSHFSLGKIFQRRWKSLRDRVRRDLTEEEKAQTSGAPAPQKKPHVYRNHLAFLRQAMIDSNRQ